MAQGGQGPFRCVGAVRNEVAQDREALNERLDRALKKEAKRHQDPTGFSAALSNAIQFKKLLFRWLNGKHLNYSYLDEARVDSEIFANPKLNAKLTTYMNQRSEALSDLPKMEVDLLKYRTEDAAAKKVILEEQAKTALERFQVLARGWWGGRVRIKELIWGIKDYEGQISDKIHQGVVARQNEIALFKAVFRYFRKKQFPVSIVVFEFRDGKIIDVVEIFEKPSELRRMWRSQRMKRQRIFPSFFSKGELGELEEGYASKWAELRSMKARLEHYELRGELSPKAKKRLDQIRLLEAKDLPYPTYAAKRWLDLMLGQREARTFFFGTQNTELKAKIEKSFPTILGRSEREELYRELEIADLASFWGRIRNKLIYSTLLMVIPWAMTSDGLVTGIKEFSTATYHHVRIWSQRYLEINQHVETRELLNRIDPEIIKLETQFFETALLKKEEQFFYAAIEFVEATTGKKLNSSDQIWVNLLLQPKGAAVDQMMVPLNLQGKVAATLIELRNERRDLLEKREVLGEDFKAYLQDRFQDRISARILERQ